MIFLLDIGTALKVWWFFLNALLWVLLCCFDLYLFCVYALFVLFFVLFCFFLSFYCENIIAYQLKILALLCIIVKDDIMLSII